jgi:hypothetical protein
MKKRHYCLEKRRFQSPIGGNQPFSCPELSGCCTNTAADRDRKRIQIVAGFWSRPSGRGERCRGGRVLRRRMWGIGLLVDYFSESFLFYGSYDLSDRDFLRSNYFIFRSGCRYRQTGNGSWSLGVEDPVDDASNQVRGDLRSDIAVLVNDAGMKSELRIFGRHRTIRIADCPNGRF